MNERKTLIRVTHIHFYEILVGRPDDQKLAGRSFSETEAGNLRAAIERNGGQAEVVPREAVVLPEPLTISRRGKLQARQRVAVE